MNSSVKKETVSSNHTIDSSLCSWAEPSPNWLEASKEWNWLWKVHVYGFGAIFVLIAFFAVIYHAVSRKTTFRRDGVHLAVMNTALFITGFLRALILFWDPYAPSNDTTDLIEIILACIISWGISTACITSSFSIMLLIFLETTKISLGPVRLKNLPCLVSITLANIFYLMLSDLVVWFHSEVKVMIFICHITFAALGLAVSIGGIRMWRNLKSSLGEIFFNLALDRDTRRLESLFVLMCAASWFGVIKLSLSLYTAIGEYGVFTDIGYVKSWPWFVVQSSLRTLESLMCAFIFFIGFNNRKTNNNTTPDICLAEVRRSQQSAKQN